MKRYLNQEETNSFLLPQFIAIESEKMLKEWTERGNMAPEEAKYLKYIITYSNKFFETVLARLEYQEREKILKRTKSFKFRIFDDYTLNKINRDMQDKLKYAAVEREHFNIWCDEIMHIHCKDCTKHFAECELHNVFEDNFIPESSWGMKNCRFAYKLPEGPPDPGKVKKFQEKKMNLQKGDKDE